MSKSLDDPRRTNGGNIRYKLADIVVIGLCCVICERKDIADMEENPAFLCLISNAVGLGVHSKAKNELSL